MEENDPDPSDGGWQFQSALSLFNHVESQVKLADQKGGLIFAADSILLAGYVSIFNSSLIAPLPAGIKVLILTSSGLASVAVLCALVLVLFSIDPVSKTEGYDQRQVFFKQIADRALNKDAKDFETNFLRLTKSELVGQILRSTHGKADWASRKLGLINMAIKFSLASLAFATVSGLFAFASQFK